MIRQSPTLSDEGEIVRQLSRVAAGHASQKGSGLYATDVNSAGKPRAVMKELDDGELTIYQKIEREHKDDPVFPFLPQFLGVETWEDGKRLLRMSNVLYPYDKPNVMDVKLGTRTFAESEVDNPKPRHDLYERMAEMYPDQITEADREVGFVTKHRWMTVRDTCSTIGTLGYRIDGVAGYLGENFADFRRMEHTERAFSHFADATAARGTCRPLQIAEEILRQLRILETAMDTSPFVADHEAIGSSLLLVADSAGRAGVFWIDFAKTSAVQNGMEVTHRRPWQRGNHEDGLLLGMGNLVTAWSNVVQNYRRMGARQHWKTTRTLLRAARRFSSVTPGGTPNRQAPRRLDFSRSLSHVAAGHAAANGTGMYVGDVSPGGRPRIVMKDLDEAELAIYRTLSSADYAYDSILRWVPQFHGVAQDGESDKRFLKITNLISPFSSPKVMDIKLGIRTFAESEVDNPKPRPDLYKKLLEMYPGEATDADRKAGYITKHRWMTVRDACSTIGTLGYRIDGVAGYLGQAFVDFRTSEDTQQAFVAFCRSVANSEEGDEDRELEFRIAECLLSQLKQLRTAMEDSAFVQRHEAIGSSILLVADSLGSVGVFWIDFAKTSPVPDTIDLTHRRRWERGNHEDGLFIGMDNLVNCWTRVVEKIQPPTQETDTDAPASEQEPSSAYSAGNKAPGSGYPCLDWFRCCKCGCIQNCCIWPMCFDRGWSRLQ